MIETTLQSLAIVQVIRLAVLNRERGKGRCM